MKLETKIKQNLDSKKKKKETKKEETEIRKEIK